MLPEQIENKAVYEFAEELYYNLYFNHQGVENSIKQKDYFKNYLVTSTSRIFCLAVSALRSKPNPIEIGSGQNGYYWIVRPEEYDLTYNWLNNKIKGQIKAVNGIKKLRDKAYENQIGLFTRIANNIDSFF